MAQDIRMAQDRVKPWGFASLFDYQTVATMDTTPIWLKDISARNNATKMIILHIPKSGGTTVCDLFKGSKLVHTSMNCWVNADGPEWCCLNRQLVKQKSCAERKEKDPPITMIERYMDSVPGVPSQTLFCPGTVYGTLLREPIRRVSSHIFNFAKMYSSQIHELMLHWEPEYFIELIDRLDQLPPDSQLARSLLSAATNGSYPPTAKSIAKGLELDLRKINAFSSNYLTRMLLGTQLGRDPLVTVSSNKIVAQNRHLRGRALEVLSKFDFVIITENISERSNLGHLGLSHLMSWAQPSPHERSSTHTTDPLLAKLKTSKVQDWFRERNGIDLDIYAEMVTRKDISNGKGTMPFLRGL